MKNSYVALGALSGFLSVALGAFAAHGLKTRLEPAMLEVFKTGVLYQFFHSLALVLVGILAVIDPGTSFRVCAMFFGVGIFLFSGSLYALSLSDVKILGAITPLGGVSFLVGWFVLFVKYWRSS